MERINPNDLRIVNLNQEPTNLTPISPASPITEMNDCPDCGGVGWFSRGVVPIGQSPIEPCHCTIARQAAREVESNRTHQAALMAKLTREMGHLATRRLETFDLGRRLEALTWEGKAIDTSAQRKALKHAYTVCQTYADHPGGWLYLYGPPGAGKSHLLAGVALALAEQGKTVAYASVPDVLDFLRSGFETRDAGARLEALKNVDFLALDDLGAESVTPWTVEKLFMLLNDRYLDDRPTGITSNIHPDDFEPHAKRLASRIAGLAQTLWLPISDYRRLR